MLRKPKHCLAKKNTSKITNLLASKSLEKKMFFIASHSLNVSP